MASLPKVLFLSPVSLASADDGVKIRGRSLLSALREFAEVKVLSFGSGPDEVPLPRPPGSWERLFSLTPSIFRCFRSADFARRVEAEAPGCQLCLALGLQMSQYFDHLPRHIATILDNFNVESDILSGLASTRTGLKRLYWRWQAWKLRRFEKAALMRTDRPVAISGADALRFQRLAPGKRFTVVAPGLDLEKYLELTPQSDTQRLVFVGALDWHVNIDAACWMANEVFPLIRAQVPEVSLAIVGRRPEARVRSLASLPGVFVHADVSEVYSYLARAAAIVVPLRFGSGVQTKVIEAAGAGRPVVTTRVALEGLEFQPGEEVLVAGDKHEFARACLRVLAQPEEADTMARAARLRARECYGRARMVHDLRVLCADLQPVSRSLPGSPAGAPSI